MTDIDYLLFLEKTFNDIGSSLNVDDTTFTVSGIANTSVYTGTLSAARTAAQLRYSILKFNTDSATDPPTARVVQAVSGISGTTASLTPGSAYSIRKPEVGSVLLVTPGPLKNIRTSMMYVDDSAVEACYTNGAALLTMKADSGEERYKMAAESSARRGYPTKGSRTSESSYGVTIRGIVFDTVSSSYSPVFLAVWLREQVKMVLLGASPDNGRTIVDGSVIAHETLRFSQKLGGASREGVGFDLNFNILVTG